MTVPKKKTAKKSVSEDATLLRSIAHIEEMFLGMVEINEQLRATNAKLIAALGQATEALERANKLAEQDGERLKLLSRRNIDLQDFIRATERGHA